VDISRALPLKEVQKRNGPVLRRGEMGNRPANEMESAGRWGKDEGCRLALLKRL
jgi:hypothetical protein